MIMRLKRCFISMVLSFLVASCNNSELYKHNKCKLFVKSVNNSIQEIEIGICGSTLKFNGETKRLVYEHFDCMNDSYIFKLTYDDTTVNEKYIGYIPGGTDVNHYVIIDDKNISVTSEVPSLRGGNIKRNQWESMRGHEKQWAVEQLLDN